MSTDLKFQELREEVFDLDEHNEYLDDFVCLAEEQALSEYIQGDASHDQIEQLTKVYLIFALENGKKKLVAYYTLKAMSYAQRDYDSNGTKTIPCIEIAQIAVDSKYRGAHIATNLFFENILPKALEVSRLIGCKAMFVFSLNEHSSRFYDSLGFEKVAGWSAEDGYGAIAVADDGYNNGLDIMIYPLTNLTL